jgi:hypothetical protein
MSIEAQRVYLSNKFTRLGMDLKVAMPNQPFDIPKNAAYGEFHILGSDYFEVGGEGEGKVRLRHVSIVQLTIWVPEGKGTKGSAMAADLFTKGFQFKQGRDSAGQIYRFKGPQVMNPSTKNGWSVTVARVPFERDEVVEVQTSL